VADPSLHTQQIRNCVERYQSGDAAAADELFRAAGARMELLTRQMLRGFPNVRAWTETADVLQSSVLRLLNTLRKIQPISTRHFYNLVGLHIRRELLDLARSFASRNEISMRTGDGADSRQADGLLLADRFNDAPDELETWCRFHSSIEQLPDEEREVLSLCYYQGWTQIQVAEVLHVSERTVRTRWQSACLKLNKLMKGQLPPL
jgi:RNA polymerase sigma factor (sigma-70 family)